MYNFFLFSLLVVFSIQGISETERFFTYVYDHGVWGKDEYGNGTSGGGATLETAGEYIVFLSRFIKKNNIKSIVDIGCGDWRVMRNVDLSEAYYLGFDVVRSVIEKNIQAFSSSKVNFMFGDCLEIDLPKADLLVCKDVFIHFPNQSIFSLIAQFHKYKHVLITNCVDPDTFTASNQDCAMGSWRRVDISAPPFNVKGKKLLIYPAETYHNHFKMVFYIQNT